MKSLDDVQILPFASRANREAMRALNQAETFQGQYEAGSTEPRLLTQRGSI